LPTPLDNENYDASEKPQDQSSARVGKDNETPDLTTSHFIPIPDTTIIKNDEVYLTVAQAVTARGNDEQINDVAWCGWR
jgi:hypothetical protein